MLEFSVCAKGSLELTTLSYSNWHLCKVPIFSNVFVKKYRYFLIKNKNVAQILIKFTIHMHYMKSTGPCVIEFNQIV